MAQKATKSKSFYMVLQSILANQTYVLNGPKSYQTKPKLFYMVLQIFLANQTYPNLTKPHQT